MGQLENSEKMLEYGYKSLLPVHVSCSSLQSGKNDGHNTNKVDFKLYKFSFLIVVINLFPEKQPGTVHPQFGTIEIYFRDNSGTIVKKVNFEAWQVILNVGVQAVF